ncbi:MAG: glycosyltransferase family 4 protein [Candidatus Lokiarchaeota archaeon]|nr:glycosyltransferase family 4 protein [Candidatus Lokiarchaeota archaeon]
MKKLKICLISLTISPDSQDGAAKFISGIYNYLKKQGHDVKVITGKWNIELKDPDIIQVKLIRKSYFWLPQFMFKVRKIMKSSNFDIVHLNGPKALIPFLFSKQKKILSTIHDLGPIETKFSRIPIEKKLIKLLIKRASIITTCSDFVRHQIKQIFPKTNINKIFNLYSAIESKFVPYPSEAEILKRKLGLEGPTLLYIGRIANYKGVPDIIKAFQIAKQQIKNLELVIGGTPDFSMKKTYEDWIEKYPDIKFTGFVNADEIPIYYSMAEIFITYSFASEGFGLTPIEAIACGTPVICSSLKVFKEVLGDNAIFVPPKRPDMLAKEIINLINDETKREKMIEGSSSYIKRFSWDSVGQKLEDVYYNFLSL